jgi:hypothetical protein
MNWRIRFVQVFVVAQEEDPATTHGDLVTLADARRGHLDAIHKHILGIRRRLDPISPLFPPDPAVHRPDVVAVKHYIAGSARPKQDGMVTPKLNELNPALPVVYF